LITPASLKTKEKKPIDEDMFGETERKLGISRVFIVSTPLLLCP